MGRDKVPGFATAIKRARASQNLSVEKLAELAKTHPKSIYKLEREERAPSLRLALALADALELSIDDLTGRTKRKGGKK